MNPARTWAWASTSVIHDDCSPAARVTCIRRYSSATSGGTSNQPLLSAAYSSPPWAMASVPLATHW